jgi:acetyl-CoA acetyltransferase
LAVPVRAQARVVFRQAGWFLEATDGTLGLEAMCVGGGQGMAMIVERL